MRGYDNLGKYIIHFIKDEQCDDVLRTVYRNKVTNQFFVRHLKQWHRLNTSNHVYRVYL